MRARRRAGRGRPADVLPRGRAFQPFAVVPRYLVGYRATPGNMSSDLLQMFRSTELVLDEYRAKYPEHAADIDAPSAGRAPPGSPIAPQRPGGSATSALLLTESAATSHPLASARHFSGLALQRRPRPPANGGLGRRSSFPLYTEVVWRRLRAMALDVIPAHNAAGTIAGDARKRYWPRPVTTGRRSSWTTARPMTRGGSSRTMSIVTSASSLLTHGGSAEGVLRSAQSRHRGSHRPLAAVPRCRRPHRAIVSGRAHAGQARGHARCEGRLLRIAPDHGEGTARAALVFDCHRTGAVRDPGACLAHRHAWRGAGPRPGRRAGRLSTPA